MRSAVAAVVLLTGCPSDDAAPIGETSGSGTSGGGTMLTSGADPTTATTTTSPGTGSSDEGSTTAGTSDTEGYQPIDCTEHCADLDSDRGVALCYACRCKNAMDGYMPPPDLVQCSEAEELPIYTVDQSGGGPELVPIDDERTECANPALLTESCGLGSRLGQGHEGEVWFKWICRDPDPDTGIYADAGLIMHNMRNGASCWFDDVDFVTGPDDFPNLDLLEGDEANLELYLENFYFTDGDFCTSQCHDADPFAYTDYFRGVMWETAGYVVGPHALVTLDGTLAPVSATHLVSPEVVKCRGCHRVGSAASCSFLAPDALGELKTVAHEQAVIDATEPDSPNWSIAYWMPKGKDITTFDAWVKEFGVAKDRILECCDDPGTDTPNCIWEPIP